MHTNAAAALSLIVEGRDMADDDHTIPALPPERLAEVTALLDSGYDAVVHAAAHATISYEEFAAACCAKGAYHGMPREAVLREIHKLPAQLIPVRREGLN